MKTTDSVMREFDKIFPCIQEGCINDGVIPEQDGSGDWQPAQCEYCYKIRFPLKELFSRSIAEARREEREKIAQMIRDEANTLAEKDKASDSYMAGMKYSAHIVDLLSSDLLTGDNPEEGKL